MEHKLYLSTPQPLTSFEHVSLPPLKLNRPSSDDDDDLLTKPFRSWTYPALDRILPPPTRLQEQQIKSLERENASLRKEMQQLLSSRTRAHELEVEVRFGLAINLSTHLLNYRIIYFDH